MSAFRLLRGSVVCAVVATASPGFAAPCAGFTDIDTTSAFCPYVDWLKNRGVTLGCTSTTLFCPGDVVSRLSMAAFMNRLGVALTPAIVYAEATGGTYDLDAPLPAVCATASIAAAPFPRSAHAGAVLTARIDTSAAIVGARIVQSTDGGATWTPLNTLPTTAGGINKYVNLSAWKGAIPLAEGVAYQFGLRVDRAPSGGSGDLASWSCQIEVMVASRTGTASPY